MSFYRDELRKARLLHECDLCRTTIKIGEKYHSKAGNQDGDIWTSSECEKCQPVISDFLENGSDDGYCEEYIRDWWVEEKCPRCVNFWPECNPSAECMPYASIRKESVCDECKNGRCTAGDYCDKMTHYCRCENFKEAQ